MDRMDVIKASMVGVVGHCSLSSSLLSSIAEPDAAGSGLQDQANGAVGGAPQSPEVTIHARGNISFESTSSRKGTGGVTEKALNKLSEVRKSKSHLEADNKKLRLQIRDKKWQLSKDFELKRVKSLIAQKRVSLNESQLKILLSTTN
jgi:hypothetical protein